MSIQSEKEFRKSLGIEDKIVYHYCSLDSLYGIVNSKSLWLTSLQSSNDKAELSISKNVLDKYLKKIIEEQKGGNEKSTFQKILDAPSDEEYRKFRQSTKYYGLSCVEKKDSLTHWDRYGGQGNGICIGINLAILDNFFEARLYGNMFRTWLIHDRVLYRENEQEHSISCLLKEKIDGLLENESFEVIPHIYSVIYYSVLNYIKPLFKHNGFYDESEYRIIFQEKQGEEEAQYYKQIAISDMDSEELFCNISDNMLKTISKLNLLYNDKRFNKFGNMIRGYYALNLKEIWSDTLISEIILGPKCYQDKCELKEFLKKNELVRTAVSVSKIPIR